MCFPLIQFQVGSFIENLKNESSSSLILTTWAASQGILQKNCNLMSPFLLSHSFVQEEGEYEGSSNLLQPVTGYSML